MKIRSFTSKTRRVCHGHIRHTGRTINQVSIANRGGGHAPLPPRAGSATDYLVELEVVFCENSDIISIAIYLKHEFYGSESSCINHER